MEQYMHRARYFPRSIVVSLLLFCSILHHAAFAQSALKLPQSLRRNYSLTHAPNIPQDLFDLELNLGLLKENNIDQVLQNLKKLLVFYLGGNLDRAAIEVAFTSRQIAPAEVKSWDFHTYIMTINQRAFATAAALRYFDKDEVEKAFLIVLFHELVHVWQTENTKNTKSTYRSALIYEGHATYLQTVFARDFGLEETNLKGLYHLKNTTSVHKLAKVSYLKAFLFVRLVNWVHLRGYHQFAKLCQQCKDEINKPSCLQQATGVFFKYE
jgi:hypothetical protein